MASIKRVAVALLLVGTVFGIQPAGQFRRPPPMPPPVMPTAPSRSVRESLPLILPPLAPWGVILRGETPSGDSPLPAAVTAAWQAYASGDALGARVELSRRLPQVVASGNVEAIAKALSLQVLAASGDRNVTLTSELDTAVRDWRVRAPNLTVWVSLFEGARLYERRNADAAAAAAWRGVMDAVDATAVAGLLARLAMAQAAIDRRIGQDALGLVEGIERVLAGSGQDRVRAAVAITKVRGLHAAGRTADADAVAAEALTFCQARGLTDAGVELALAEAETQRGVRSREALARAERAAIVGGVAGQPRLSTSQLQRLYAFAQGSASVAEAREFDRWAASTGHGIARVLAKYRLGDALARAGEPGTGSWHSAIGGDLEATTIARLPETARWLTLLQLDYDLLTATRALERGVEPLTATNYVELTDRVLTFSRAGVIARVWPGTPQREQPVRMLARTVEAERLRARQLLARGERQAAATAFRVFFDRLQELNRLRPFEDDDPRRPDRRVVYVSSLVAAYLAQAPGNLSRSADTLGAGSGRRDWDLFPHLLHRRPAGLSILNLIAEAEDDDDRDARDEPDVREQAAAIRVALDTPRDGTVPWSRVITRRAEGAVASQAASVVLFNSAPAQLGGDGTVHLGLLEAGQLALTAAGDVRFARLRPPAAFERYLPLLRDPGGADEETREELQALAAFGMRLWLSALALPTSDEFIKRLIDVDGRPGEGPPLRRLLHSTLSSTVPQLDVLDVGADADEALEQLQLVALALEHPMLLSAIAYRMSDAVAVQPIVSELTTAERRAAPPVPGGDPFVPTKEQVRRLRVQTLLDGALVSIAGRHYRSAAGALAEAAASTTPERPLELVQIHYLTSLCHRALGNALAEEAALGRAVDLLEEVRRVLPTRNASLRLRELRQLLQEEYLTVLHRQSSPERMAQVIARYRTASLIPAAVVGAGTPRQDAELATLRELYDVLATATERSPVTPADLEALLEAFGEESDVPVGEPTLNAVADATDFVVDEMARGSTVATLASVAARRARPGELIVMQAVGRDGVYIVTSDPQGRTRAHYRAVPLETLQTLCASFNLAIASDADATVPSARLFEILLAGLPELVGKRRISILADGPLQTLAWQALQARPGAPPLVSQFEIEQLSGVPSDGSPAASTGDQLRVLIVADANGPLRAPGAQIEDVARALGSDRVRQMPADESGRLPAELEWARDLLFAAHAESSRARPHYSHLQLGARRVYSIDFRAYDFRGRRVFFAACLTRDADTVPGEELYGLADAALARRASEVVATLWQVDATAAYRFAALFYEAARDGADAAAAATVAARTMITAAMPPRTWAAHQVVGRVLVEDRRR